MKKNIEQTSEEERVVFYNDSAEPTVPSQVTAKTKLEALNLNWRERDLPEKIRTKHVHRLHPYLGKYIPQLVEIFLRKYFKPGQTVLDPFSGSGTTLVQANELGIHSVGYDISAFNIVLARAKTKTYDLKKVRGEILDILERVHQATQNEAQQLSLWTDGKKGRRKEKVNEYLHAWYAPAALHELITYRDLISEYDDQDLLKVILSRAARSARLTTHFDLDFPKKPQTEPYWCYKHSRTCTPTQDAYQFIKRYSLDTIKRIEEFAQQRTNATVQIFHDDSRKAQIPMIDGVMTSPPYVGLIDYHDQHRYAYELLGLEDRSGFEIGPASGGSSQKAKRKYQEGIAEVFTNALKSMTKGGRLIVVAGDRHDLYGEIATMCDVNVEAVLQRHVNRRTGRRSGEFFESVFIWRKK
ncbi:MAG TPA: DNA methyltransferase [Anaerolineales bacterium]|nr:DNA methyltransferase [Anaerolineales bacterium]HNB36044.1 DNA methyltransferase [Anaerolineales bacterium]